MQMSLVSNSEISGFWGQNGHCYIALILSLCSIGVKCGVVWRAELSIRTCWYFYYLVALFMVPVQYITRQMIAVWQVVLVKSSMHLIHMTRWSTAQLKRMNCNTVCWGQPWRNLLYSCSNPTLNKIIFASTNTICGIRPILLNVWNLQMWCILEPYRCNRAL